METFLAHLTALAWPAAVALAWVMGEVLHRAAGLPRISVYGLVGFLLGHAQLGLLPAEAEDSLRLLASLAFGLILFEFGYRINLRWLKTNPWIGATGVLEALLSFVVVDAVAMIFGTPPLTALLLASLAMSSSPAALMRVLNDERSAGQVTERMLHLAAVNCVLAVFTFEVIVGFWIYQTSGSLWQAVSRSVLVLTASVALGGSFGVVMPALLRHVGRVTRDATLAFAIGVMLLVAIAHVARLSPVLAALTFGLVARHRRVSLNPTQRNFGALGDLLTIVLFVFVSNTIAWQRVWSGLGLALALIVVRQLTKVGVIGVLARPSGVTWRKGVLTGVAMTPISVFVILLMAQVRFVGIDLIDQLAPLAAVTLLLELLGPIATQRALAAAGECMEQDR